MAILTFILKTCEYYLTSCVGGRSAVAVISVLHNVSDENTGSSVSGRNDCKISGTKTSWPTVNCFTGLCLELATAPTKRINGSASLKVCRSGWFVIQEVWNSIPIMPQQIKKEYIIKQLSVAIITVNCMTAGVEPIPETSCTPIPNITLPYIMDSV
jgi:hypothetical protein